jgi:hypothetical protein
MYGHAQQKPTDFFSNFPLELLETQHHKLHCTQKKHKLIINTNLRDRYKIPEKLIKSIVSQLL